MIHLLIAAGIVAALPNPAPIRQTQNSLTMTSRVEEEPPLDEKTNAAQESLKVATFFLKKGDYAKAVTAFNRIPDDVNPRTFLAHWRDYGLAEAYYHLEQYDKCAELYRKVLYEPTKKDLRITLTSGEVTLYKTNATEREHGVTFDPPIRAAKIEGAEDGGQQLDTSNSVPLIRLAISLYHLGKIEEAVFHYNTALTPLNYVDGHLKYKVPQLTSFKVKGLSKPTFLAAAYTALGMEACHTSQEDIAMQEFERALEYSDRNVSANYYFGRLLLQFDKPAEAKKCLDRAVQYGDKKVAELVAGNMSAVPGF